MDHPTPQGCGLYHKNSDNHYNLVCRPSPLPLMGSEKKPYRMLETTAPYLWLEKEDSPSNGRTNRYAADLCKESCLSLCDSLRGELSTSKTWIPLRYRLFKKKDRIT
ncbi:hypothetical protein HPB48_013257 [Haemaphysalis longicornis]|uniref:Uncharacterized protein n=1 Tax=Haemaphysalis longicornis TaxID=44386 RepID=A0A9J6H2I9_HAELO|nr:hypothetical protein HPB48_013257 [Haemaphysalis longicornis]